MPITFAHPAAAIPLLRFRLPLSALVAGSVMPDLPYFIHLSTGAGYAHTPKGLVTFCLPAGLVSLWVFHALLKRPLLSLAPPTHRGKLASSAHRFAFLPLRRLLRISLSILIGAVTHVVWDSFTHANGWMVLRVSLLAQPLVVTPYGYLYTYKVLQYLSSLCGTLLLIWWYRRWVLKADSVPAYSLPAPAEPARRLWIATILLLPATIAGAHGLWLNYSPQGIQWVYLFARDFVLMYGVTLTVTTCAYCAVWHAGVFSAKQSGPSLDTTTS